LCQISTFFPAYISDKDTKNSRSIPDSGFFLFFYVEKSHLNGNGHGSTTLQCNFNDRKVFVKTKWLPGGFLDMLRHTVLLRLGQLVDGMARIQAVRATFPAQARCVPPARTAGPRVPAWRITRNYDYDCQRSFLNFQF
jgi:hypothetical protein